MAKLPSAADLSGPTSFRTGRQYFSADTSAAGRGLASLGGAISAVAQERQQQENTVDIARAEALKTEGLLATQNEFDVDPDYATYQERAPKKTGDVISKAGNVIRDSKMRERWLLGARSDAARVNDGIFDKGVKAKRDAEIVAFDNALETNRRIYVDPETPDDVRAKAKQDIDGSIKTGLETGLFDAAEADKRRKVYLEDAEYSRAKLAIDKDPAKFIPRGKIAGMIAQRAQAAGVDPNIAVGIAYIESGLNPNAQNPNSSADGLFQFIDGTAKQYGLTDKLNPEANADAGVRFTKDNIDGLRRAYGREPTPGEAYLAHFSGFGLAKKLGAADPNTPAEQIFSPQAVKANASILRGKTVGEVRAWADKKMADAIAKSGGEMPDYVQNVSPERRAELSDYAERRYQEYETQLASQNKAIANQAIDDFSLRIATGDIGLTQSEILESPVIDNGQKATLINSFNSKLEEVGNTAAAVQAFAAGGLQVDPYDTKGKATVDNTYDALTKAVAPEQVRPLAEELVRQTGVVPKQVMSSIRQGLSSNDPVQIEQAAQAAQRISTLNPAALSRREGGAEIQRAADDFDHYVNKLNLSPADAARRIQEANDPRKAVERKAIEPAAKQFVKTLEKFDLANEFDPGMFGSDPALGATPAQALGIQAEFLAIAEDQFFATNGDPELAKSRAVEQMKRLYGASGLGGGIGGPSVIGGAVGPATASNKVLMKHPPEMFWPKDMQSETGNPMQYAIDALLGDVHAQDDAVMDGSIRLVTTPETDAMVKRGEVPAYAVMWTDKNGMVQTIPGKLWRPDFTGVLGKAKQAREKTVGDARQLDADIKAGRDREGSMDSFLGITPENFLGGGE